MIKPAYLSDSDPLDERVSYYRCQEGRGGNRFARHRAVGSDTKPPLTLPTTRYLLADGQNGWQFLNRLLLLLLAHLERVTRHPRKPTCST
jgi:hypothetical protein